MGLFEHPSLSAVYVYARSLRERGRQQHGTLDTSHSHSGQIVPAITAAISAISGHLDPDNQ